MKTKKNSIFAGIRYLIKLYVRHNKIVLFFLTAYCLLSGLLPFAAIVFPKFILDELMGAQHLESLAVFTGSLLLCTLFGNTLIHYFWKKYFIGSMIVQDYFSRGLTKDLYEADIEHIEAASFMELAQRAMKFIMADGINFGGVLKKAMDVSAHIITLVGIISIISILNPIVVIIFIGLTIATAWFNSNNKKANIKLDMERAPYERIANYYGSLAMDHHFIKETRINIMGSWLLKKSFDQFNRLVKFYDKAHTNNLKVQIFSNLMTFFQQGIAYTYLIYSVINGRFSIGSFTMYLAAINTFSGTMFAVMDSIVDIRRFSDYYEAVDMFINSPKRQREGKKPLKLSSPPLLEFRNVSFRYLGQHTYTLKNINLVIQNGEKLSIVGENGAGKTTLVKLLMRLYRPTEGQILLNGVDIQEFDFDDYERTLSVVLQDFALFAMSLRENVTAGQDANDSVVIDALRKSGFGDKLDTLAKGLDTPIYKTLDDNGFEPSGGEEQKIAIARALFKNGQVVILDEPTAALDPRAEYEIYQNFNRMVEGKSAIFISHRLSSSQFCDKIAVFKKGEIVEYGSHAELLNQNGLYHELFAMQAQFYEEKAT
jgi:ATP-binding cassette subfamily B protein/ATP-binding cassette subfamily C protein